MGKWGKEQEVEVIMEENKGEKARGVWVSGRPGRLGRFVKEGKGTRTGSGAGARTRLKGGTGGGLRLDWLPAY